MSKAILCDFDGTIVDKDIINGILDKFADNKWRYYEDLWEQGKVGSTQSVEKQIALMKGTEDQVIEYINKIMKPDPYFSDFVKMCDKKGIELAIVSDGLDIYIKEFLKNYEMDIRYFTNKLEFEDDGPKVTCPNLNEKCGWCCTCKFNIVNKYKAAYDKVYYVGDGLTDKHASQVADVVFAKKKLIDICEQQNIEYIEFDDFKDIIDYFDEDMYEECIG